MSETNEELHEYVEKLENRIDALQKRLDMTTAAIYDLDELVKYDNLNKLTVSRLLDDTFLRLKEGV